MSLTHPMTCTLELLKQNIELALERRKIWADIHPLLMAHIEALTEVIEQQLGFVLQLTSTDLWEGQPDLCLSFGTNPIGLAKATNEKRSETNLITESGASLRLSPKVNGILKVEYISPGLDGQTSPPHIELIAQIEPEGLQDQQLINHFIEQFFSLTLRDHWSASHSPVSKDDLQSA